MAHRSACQPERKGLWVSSLQSTRHTLSHPDALAEQSWLPRSASGLDKLQRQGKLQPLPGQRISCLRGLTGWNRSHSRCTGSCRLSPSCPSTSEMPFPCPPPRSLSVPACVPENLLEHRCHPLAPAAACVEKAFGNCRMLPLTASSPRSTVRNSPARASRQGGRAPNVVVSLSDFSSGPVQGPRTSLHPGQGRAGAHWSC